MKKKLIELNNEEKKLYFIEAFLKRSSIVKGPFSLKGDLLTRQYLKDMNKRVVRDIDFLCTERIEKEEEAHRIFSEWINKSIKINLNDGIKFDVFEEYDDWENFSYDYDSGTDFEPVNEKITGRYNDENGREKEFSFRINISFNFETTSNGISLEYKSDFFDDIYLEKTIELEIQAAWKLYQTIVRPRLKDIVDLCYLIENKEFTEESVEKTLKEVKNECDQLNLNKNAAKKIILGNLSKIYTNREFFHDYDFENYAGDKNEFFEQHARRLRKIMNEKGFTQEKFDEIF